MKSLMLKLSSMVKIDDLVFKSQKFLKQEGRFRGCEKQKNMVHIPHKKLI